MKTTIPTIILSSLILCSCSPRQPQSGSLAIDRIQPGKEIVLRGKGVLRIKKRNGTSVEGIELASTSPDGQKTTIIASTGAISPVSLDKAADANSIKLVLYDAHGETLALAGNKLMDLKRMETTIILKKDW